MELKAAIDSFGALAQETRLAVFRLLIKAGRAGLPAGAIAQEVGVAPSTLSSHLGVLERSGLLYSWRVQRQIFYAADYDSVRGLLTFLMEDCCQGNPEICGPVPTAADPEPRRAAGGRP